MAVFRSFQDIVISFIEYLRLITPDADTKPGTVIRDIFIDAPSQELANLYSELRNVSNLQSLFSASGSDLVKLASNFGMTKSTGSVASGIATLTTKNMSSDIYIPQGSILTSRNGITFKTTDPVLMSSANANVYKANASRVQQDLLLAGITDTYSIDVTVEASVTGRAGNIGRFTLRSHNIPGISNVTNLSTFSGGTGAESDAEFRNRIISIFAGSNTGTTLGYETSLSVLNGVQDSIVVVPGNPLLTRDGTIVTTNSSGTKIVSDPGTGGKVDIYILGSNLESEVDSFIYNDESGKDDSTDSSNDIILGQRGEDTNKNISQRRVELLASNQLPFQPIDSILSVVGSSSGANFVEKYTDSTGKVRGNFELIKDSGDYSGSPFGYDKLHWISNQIELDDETLTKGQFNGTDALNFSDVNRIRKITQDLVIFNENSTVNSSNRTSVQLNLVPIRTVSRVYNVTTGERYIVSNQNPDGIAGQLNTTGRITISGSTLPTATDILQVDYTWVQEFDDTFDFDNLHDIYSERTAQDSVDWGFGNYVKNEEEEVREDAYGNLTVSLYHNISKILSVNKFSEETVASDGGIVVLSDNVSNIIDMKRTSDGSEIYNTDLHNGTITGSKSVILPTDTLAVDGDLITIRYNAIDLFSPDGYDLGTFSSNIINLPTGSSFGGENVLVNYIANVFDLVLTNISNLPATKYLNKFVVSGVVTGEQPTSNVLSGTTITKNLRRAASHIKLNLSSIPSAGTITVAGTTVKKLSDVLVTVTSGSGLEVDLAPAIKTYLGTNSLGSNIKVIKLNKIERVNLNTSRQVSSVDNVYDIVNYKLYDNSYDLDVALKDSSLSLTKISLPPTSNNSSALLTTGDVVRVSFYFVNTSSSETLYFSKDTVLITKDVYLDVSRIYSTYGFKNASGSIEGFAAIRNLNQPLSNTSYKVSYDYVSPKENERITVTFNYNKLISDATTVIENVRPITADVLVKQAKERTIDATIKIVLLTEYLNQSQTVVENAKDAIVSFLNAHSLGTTIDSSDVVNTLYSVAGIDRVRILSFGFTNEGNVLSVTANSNEYLSAGTVNITTETR